MESGLAIIKKRFDYSNSRRENLKLFFPPALYLIVNLKHIICLGVPPKVVSNVQYTNHNAKMFDNASCANA